MTDFIHNNEGGEGAEASFTADIYLRLSREDGDKEESDSIANQRMLILEHLKCMPDIRVHQIRVDDGYSGIDFDRPAFRKMIQDIEAGIVNCVVVKDFSRFGRNYIETGKYIQVLFPRSGIRFIAVNDAYDSIKDKGYADHIIVPFKNIVNDAYCADISVKVRSHLEIKRKKGDFVGAFAVYGYKKDEKNHNRLVIDSFAADVVRDIFKWKIDGMSACGIAEKLNESGILSPMEYKRYSGLRFYTGFKANTTARWTALAVGRILKNAVYTGVLEQGKRMTPNYKVRKRVNVPKEKWICVENAHEPVICRDTFDTVQSLLEQDTRAVKKRGVVYPLAGMIFCGGCGGAMVRKNNTKNGKRYSYYVCAEHRADPSVCSTHMIRADFCEHAVLAAIKLYSKTAFDKEMIAWCAERLSGEKDDIRKRDERLKAKETEEERYRNYRLSLYESYQEGMISHEDFLTFKAGYDEKIQEVKAAIIKLKEESAKTKKESEKNDDDKDMSTDRIFEFLEASELERRMAALFIRRIAVHEGSKIEITFSFFWSFYYAGR